MELLIRDATPDDAAGIVSVFNPIIEARAFTLFDAPFTIATQLGAKVALPKTSVPGVGAYAAIIDPQGNICGLWEQSAGA
jgi:predicted enzyme related to lactoylglutathione lyase